jgi:hypothetical protein
LSFHCSRFEVDEKDVINILNLILIRISYADNVPTMDITLIIPVRNVLDAILIIAKNVISLGWRMILNILLFIAI